MKRDMDLIRLLLLRLEAEDMEADTITVFDRGGEELRIEGYTNNAVQYHLPWLLSGGLVEGKMALDGFEFERLSWDGCDLLDKIRDDQIWQKTRDGAKRVGGFSVKMLGDLAEGFIKKKIRDHTGVEF
jgi:hypothetical protein